MFSIAADTQLPNPQVPNLKKKCSNGAVLTPVLSLRSISKKTTTLKIDSKAKGEFPKKKDKASPSGKQIKQVNWCSYLVCLFVFGDVPGLLLNPTPITPMEHSLPKKETELFSPSNISHAPPLSAGDDPNKTRAPPHVWRWITNYLPL